MTLYFYFSLARAVQPVSPFLIMQPSVNDQQMRPQYEFSLEVTAPAEGCSYKILSLAIRRNCSIVFEIWHLTYDMRHVTLGLFIITYVANIHAAHYKYSRSSFHMKTKVDVPRINRQSHRHSWFPAFVKNI